MSAGCCAVRTPSAAGPSDSRPKSTSEKNAPATMSVSSKIPSWYRRIIVLPKGPGRSPAHFQRRSAVTSMARSRRSHKLVDGPSGSPYADDHNNDGMKALKHHSNTREGAVRAPRIQWRFIAVALLLPAALPTAHAQTTVKSAESQGPSIEE